MGIVKHNRVNIVITNKFLRYSYYNNNKVLSYGEVKLPNGIIKDGSIQKRSALLEVVQELVKEHKWKRKKLFFCIPDDMVVIRQLQIPEALTYEEALEFVKTQIGTTIYLPFGEPAIDIDMLDMEQEQRNILLFAYPKEKIIAFDSVFKEAGLKAVVVDLTSLSTYRYFYKQLNEDANNVLQIHWNQDALVLTAFRDHKAIFTRYMKLDVNEEQSMKDEAAAIQVIDEYMREINRIIDFYQFSITKGEARINLLLLTGDFPFLGLVHEKLSNTISIQIQPFSDDTSEKFVDVVGLAMKQEVRKGEQ